MINSIITYDSLQASFTPDQLVAFLQANKYVSEWLNPFGQTYIVKSDAPFLNLYISVRRFFEKTPFVFAQIDANATSGILTDQMWNWINQGVLPSPLAAEIAKSRKLAGSPEAVKIEDQHNA